MSLSDECQDLTTEYLIKKVKLTKRLKDQMTIMRELDTRVLSAPEYYELLESCNGY
jgi:hypothetical protein